MKEKWPERAIGIHERFVNLARLEGNLCSDKEIIRFLALAICGEAGELANLIKKSWRGDIVDHAEIVGEIADIRIYLEHLSRILALNLDEECDRKLDRVERRLTEKEGRLKRRREPNR